MGYLAVGLVCVIGGIFLGLTIAAVREGGENTRRIDVLKARTTVSDIHRILRKYKDGLDSIGQAMYDELDNRINKYWRGDN